MSGLDAYFFISYYDFTFLIFLERILLLLLYNKSINSLCSYCITSLRLFSIPAKPFLKLIDIVLNLL